MFKIVLIFVISSISIIFANKMDIKDLSVVNQEDIKAIMKTFALGGDYKAVHYATPEGIKIGFDLGIEATIIKLDDKFKNALASMGNNINDIPSYLPLPRLNITKGLPFNLDVGFSILKLNINGVKILNWGGSVKYAILNGTILWPAVSIRGTFNKGDYFDVIKTTTYGIEALVSKNFLFLEPFGGFGYQTAATKFSISKFLPSELPNDPSVNLEPNVSQARLFAGATLKLGFLHLALQADFAKVQTYSTKLSINF